MYSVAPYSGGIFTALRTVVRAGTVLKELSECQSWFARLLRMTLLLTGRSSHFESRLVPAPSVPTFVVSSSPSLSEKRICASLSISWFLKTKTEYFFSDSMIYVHSDSSNWSRLKSLISAASKGCKGRICMGNWVLLIRYVPVCEDTLYFKS